MKANAAAASPADGSVGWVAVLSTGDFGISATSADLDKIGVTKAADKLEMKIQ